MNKKYILFLLSLFFLLFYIWYDNYKFKDNFLIGGILDDSFKNEIIQTRTLYSKHLDLYYSNSKIPYVSNEDYYLLSTLNKDNFYENILNYDGFKMRVFSENDNWIELLIYNEKYYNILKLQLTNLPVLTITKKEEDKKYSYMMLYEPNLENTVVKKNQIIYDLRGGTAIYSNKKSYKLEVIGNMKKEKKVSFLGMKKDSNWILNPLWFDSSYVREKVSYDIWNGISDMYQHNMEYVELVIDNDYKGIYCLQEKVDLETFDAKKNSLLISVKYWEEDIDDPKLFREDFVLKSDFVDRYQFEEGIVNNNSLRLEILRSFVNSVNEENTSLKIKYDFDNSVNYNLFINLIMASDNTSKNQKILFRKENDSYIVVKTPWDLDYSFGNEKIDVNFSDSGLYKDTLLPSSLRDNKKFYSAMKDKYFKLRKSIYNEEWISNKIEEYISLLSYSALSRDVRRWNNHNFEDSVDIVKLSLLEQIDFLDQYFGGNHEV